MYRRVALLILLLSAFVVTMPTVAQDKAKEDIDKYFAFADKNKDKKLSRAEFRDLVKNNPRYQENPKLADQVFDYLDADKDGSLTLAEFRKVSSLMQPKDKGKDEPAVKETPATAEGVAFFEKKIRPVLVAKCFGCHSAEKKVTKGELALDTRAGVRAGGGNGVVIVPGRPEKSSLIKALRHTGDIHMPPKEKLSDEVIADFERWVKMGAPDPRTGEAKVARSEIDVEKGRRFWAFQRPKDAAAPTVKNTDWPRDDIDRHLLAALEAKGLKPAGDADRRTLLRRAYFDLIGLPPTPEQIEAFVKDDSAKAFEKVVDGLLTSERFGERWGRHWLDVARYAESSGRQVNINYPHAWRYRDWVIAAFNADMPYDRFITTQLAGDLLPSKDPKQRAEQIIATGFLAIGPKPHNERSGLQFAYDVVDEQIDTTSQAFLGLTVACARCHDHKFDPIPTKDYYALAGIFRSMETKYGTVRVIQNNHPSDLYPLDDDSGQPAGVEKATRVRLEAIKKQVASAKTEVDALRKDGKLFGSVEGVLANARLTLFQAQLDRYDSDGNAKRFAMGVRDRTPKDSPLYQRGEIDKPGEVVPRGFVQVVSRTPPKVKEGSGRLELAQWLTKDNPLTARVMVNRVWLHLFGRGLVATPDNFGTTGQPPSHPALLDHLAASFERDWSVKKLIRRIVLSRAYQLASTFNDRNFEADPDNALVWRMSKRRLEAEPLRDAMMAVAGVLNVKPPMGSPVAMLGDGFSQGILRGGAVDAKMPWRSVYLPVVRDYQLDSMSLFDFPDATVISGERATTTVPSQALYLLNNPFVILLSEGAAVRLLKEGGDDAPRIETAYLRFLGRLPSAKERKTAEDFLADYPKTLAKDGVPAARQRFASWSALCQALFCSAEFQHRD